MGIDYGMGQTNIDHETGIRYGVISANDVGPAWYDSAEADYGKPTCPECGNECVEYDIDAHGEYQPMPSYSGLHRCEDYACERCGHYFGSDDAYGEEPLGWYVDDAEYQATQGGDDCDIFVIRSPYYTCAEFCSPCAPGACYLTSPDDDGEKAYCFGEDWFDGDKAPYPIWRVADDSLIYLPGLVRIEVRVAGTEEWTTHSRYAEWSQDVVDQANMVHGRIVSDE